MIQSRPLSSSPSLQIRSETIPSIDLQLNPTNPLIQISDYLNLSRPEDRLPDYSYAGYQASKFPIPKISILIGVLQPTHDETDRTSDIQDALDVASRISGGGVVELAAGHYYLSSDLSIRLPSSVVLRGESSQPSQTILHIQGSPRTLFQFGDPNSIGSLSPQQGLTSIQQSYVPLGATSVEVEDASAFKLGQSIVLHRIATPAWIQTMGMNHLIRNHKHEHWISPGTSIQQEREISAIDGHRISWTVPLTDPLDSNLSDQNLTLIAYTPPDRIQESGLEHLTMIQSPSATHLPVGTKTILPINLGGAQDCWIQNIRASGFIEFAYFNQSSRRITLQDFTVYKDQPTAHDGQGALPLDITLGGSQALVLRGTTLGDQDTASYIVSTARLAMGPNVISDYTALGSTRHMIEPHQRWSTGLLVVSCFLSEMCSLIMILILHLLSVFLGLVDLRNVLEWVKSVSRTGAF